MGCAQAAIKNVAITEPKLERKPGFAQKFQRLRQLAVVSLQSGGIHYATRIVPGLALMIAAVWLGAWLG
jgi:hypothetical protein